MARPWSSSRRRTFVWLVFVVAACCVAFGVVYWFTVRTVRGRELADTAIRGSMLTRSQIASAVNGTLDVVTSTALIAAVAGICLVALIRMRRELGLAAIGLLVAANISNHLLKVYFLSRPDLGLDESTPATLNSLPSGHTTAAYSIGIAALFVVPPVLRSVTVTATIVFSSAVAVATLSAGWHRVADSLASFLLVSAWTGVAGLALLVADPAAGAVAPTRTSRPAGLWWLATAAGLASVGVTLIAAVGLDRGFRESVAGPPTAFVAGAMLVAGAAAGLTVLALRVVTRVTAEPPSAAGPEPEPDGGD